MLTVNRPIVVNCHGFDDAIGGNIVLHYLVHRLRELGVEAYAFPPMRDYSESTAPFVRKVRRWLRKAKYSWGLKSFTTHASMDVPVAPLSAFRRGIAVYPETIDGNPLECPCVVRWILFTPRGHGVGPTFATKTPNEEVFFFQPLFVKDIDWIPEESWLRLQWVRHDLFYDAGQTNRTEICRMVRKGHETASAVPPGAMGATLLDGMTNEEIAEVFKRARLFYCHDPYSMYCDYAALSGCTPIVVPKPGVSCEDWRPEADRFGIAYGDSHEQIAWAEKTRDKLKERIEDLRRQEHELLMHFVERLAATFP